jgi:excisionase family DNA binding protein
MEGIIISISKEALSDLIQGAVRSALTEFRKSVSQADDPKDDLLPAEEAAAFLDIKLSTLYYKTHHREIPFMKRGKKIYCSRKELLEWMGQGRQYTRSESRSMAEERLAQLRKKHAR